MNDNLKPVATLPPFRRLCMTIGELPTSYLGKILYKKTVLLSVLYAGVIYLFYYNL